jgi:hypothetical protein
MLKVNIFTLLANEFNLLLNYFSNRSVSFNYKTKMSVLLSM